MFRIVGISSAKNFIELTFRNGHVQLCNCLKNFRHGETSSILKGHCRWMSRSRSKADSLSFETNANVTRDTLLFRYSNDRYFKLLSLFGVAQLPMWLYAAYSGTLLVDTSNQPGSSSTIEERKLPWYFRINMGTTAFKIGYSTVCLFIGGVLGFIAYIYPLRAVSRVILLQGGRGVDIQTYAAFGKKTSFTVPLNHVSCERGRSHVKSTHTAMRIKGKSFNFLLDVKGEFPNGRLFDMTVGTKKKF